MNASEQKVASWPRWLVALAAIWLGERCARLARRALRSRKPVALF